jgi:class 3 adenylate cyclase
MALYNRHTEVSFESLGASTHRLVFSQVDASQSIDPALYWNILGTIERLPVIWDLPDARIDEEEGPFNSDAPSRRLVIKLRHSNPEKVRWGFRVLGGLAGGIVGALTGSMTSQALVMGMSAAIGCFVVLWLMEIRWRWRVERELSDEGRQLESLIAAQDSRYQDLWDEERKLRRSLLASQKLSGYLPGDLVDEILENPEMETTLGGRRTDAAVLFVDLVGFTPRTERRSPEDVVDELNLYFSYIDPAFRNNRGVIDKRMGDGVMAVFVPARGESMESVRLRAVLCGLEILRALAQCNRTIEQRGGEPLAARVGIAAGPLVQGTMGSAVKFEYTVIGDVVNTAARLEGQATVNHVVVSADVFDSLSEGGAIPGLPVDRRLIRVKGKAESIEVVEILPLDGVPS